MIRIKRSVSLALVGWLIACTIAQAEVQSDFDSDGVSDFTLVTINPDKSLTWHAESATQGSIAGLGSFGSDGNHSILAHWLGVSVPQIGVVELNASANSINWRIVNDQGAIEEQQLGIAKDVVVSGGDFNGNGLSDGAVVHLQGTRAHWTVRRDMFSPSGAAPDQSIVFGQQGDRVFFVNPDGQNDWLALVRKAGNQSSIIMKNLVSGEIRKKNGFARLLTVGQRPRPFPIQQDNGADIIGVAKSSANVTRIYTYALDGTRLGSATFSGKGDVIVGNFTSSPGEEIAFKTEIGFSLFNPIDQSLSSVESGDGIPVDHININTFSNTGSSGPDEPDSDEPPSSVESCPSVKSWPSSHIYKTVGSEHFSDIRRNTIGVVIKPGGVGPFPSCISAVDREGNVLARLGLYERGNGWAARYYAGIACGSSTPYNGSSVAARARSNTGSSSIYMNFGSVCFGPIDASRCIGSSQC